MNLSEIFINIEEHLLKDEKPSIYLNIMKNRGLLDKVPFLWLKRLENVQQSSEHHPEGDVWKHTMMVVDKGVEFREKAEDKRAFMWSLLLHDIGKFTTTKLRNGKWTSYDHDKEGEKETEKFLRYFTNNENFIFKTKKLVRYHMHLLFLSKNMPFADEKGLIKNVDINDISLVFLSDRTGRGGITKKKEKDIESQVSKFYKKYSKIEIVDK